MSEPIRNETMYLALETGGGLFAIPICDIRFIVAGTQAMRPTVLPRMPEYVKGVALVAGQLTTIITLPGDRTDVQLLGKPIVILAHPKRTIGVIANGVNLTAIPEKSISVDSLTGAKTYTEGSNTFTIVDTKNILKDMEYGT